MGEPPRTGPEYGISSPAKESPAGENRRPLPSCGKRPICCGGFRAMQADSPTMTRTQLGTVSIQGGPSRENVPSCKPPEPRREERNVHSGDAHVSPRSWPEPRRRKYLIIHALPVVLLALTWLPFRPRLSPWSGSFRIWSEWRGTPRPERLRRLTSMPRGGNGVLSDHRAGAHLLGADWRERNSVRPRAAPLLPLS